MKSYFAKEFPRTRFISEGPATKVEKRMGDLLPLLDPIVGGTKIIRFRDQDGLTPEEIADKRSQGVCVMSEYRNIESLLLSDGILKRLCQFHGKTDGFSSIQKGRDEAQLNAGSDCAPDDRKPTAQAVHHAARKALALSRSGETKEAFMRYMLAPLVTSDLPEYQPLKGDISGQ